MATYETLESGGVAHLIEKIKECCEAAGPAYQPDGTSSQIVLGDGTTIDISTFLTNNIETIRTALGLATTEHAGLVPQLPQVK